ncbi:hypothetical protein [Lactobacillus helveticus]|uniref:hypothetical protein n=2 Tax=Lactobacillus helveticus TaxID=1587 RepID=UPI0003B89BAE|nr:hypothetical protein [Lactobacillus helveticus]MBW8000288.1 hypothetical protein [Lactobacillus helveticus]MBW8064156.1 hypothetical protein [Lactobacillus helveticus]NRD36366.1 hypothetical protein [Lactobacillus helveticus]CDI63941.1 Putative uncharacterized protein [Lactobacillus helveticus CIRM-BIA 103]BCD38235.1 hypothetical protein LBHL_07920 [Lactobacillus helveticus]
MIGSPPHTWRIPKRAIVERFKLEKAKKQSDKQLITSLTKEVQDLRLQVDNHDQLIDLIKQIDAKVDLLPEKISNLISPNNELEPCSDSKPTSLNSLLDTAEIADELNADNNTDDNSESEQSFDFDDNGDNKNQ